MTDASPKPEIKQLKLVLEHNIIKKEYNRLLQENKFPKPLIEKSYKITVRRLESGYKSALKKPVAYFREVLFRMLFENSSQEEEFKNNRMLIKERILLKSFINDLHEAGYSRLEIYSRLLDIYGERISNPVLDEFEKILLSSKCKLA